ncbi:MAG: NHL repeat-containing protein [Gammaproteobacteria bacterium]|nr:NHL repeat-containing protein [Gammaproteobacteria bacterium]
MTNELKEAVKSRLLITVLFMAQLMLTQYVVADDIPVKNIDYIFIAGEQEGLSLPTDLVVDGSGQIYVVDSGNDRIAIFSEDGEYLRSFGQTGKLPGQFSGPVGIAIDSQQRLLVADKGNNRIQIFDLRGNVIKTFETLFKSKAVNPVDVVVSKDGKRIYVTGNKTHNVMVYGSNGKLLHHWGGEGSAKSLFRYPATAALSDRGLLYIVDVLNTRVQAFDEKGKHVINVGGWGVLQGQLFRPKGVALDSSGNIYVGDSYMGVIQVFDSNHRFSHVLGDGGDVKTFSTPAGIFVDARNRLYVAEMLENQVSVYQLR